MAAVAARNRREVGLSLKGRTMRLIEVNPGALSTSHDDEAGFFGFIPYGFVDPLQGNEPGARV